MLKPTKNTQTKIKYLERANNKASAFAKQMNLNPLQHPGEFITWIMENTAGKSSSNWRQVKASCIYYFEANNLHDRAEQLSLIEGEHIGLSKPKATSAKKKKSISEPEENKIITFLQNSVKNKKNYWDKPTLVLFKAGLLTGLRPIEWEDSEFIATPIDGVKLTPPILKVRNAKATNNRSYGEFRYLGLAEYSEQNKLWVKMASLQAKKPTNADGTITNYNNFYNSTRTRFKTLQAKLFPRAKKNISLYSCRHQFIANAKASGLSLVEIACLVGHGTDVTASEHYGRKKNGRAGNFPQVNEADLNKIRQLYNAFSKEPDSPEFKNL